MFLFYQSVLEFEMKAVLYQKNLFQYRRKIEHDYRQNTKKEGFLPLSPKRIYEAITYGSLAQLIAQRGPVA
ncbi:MAG: hypothetical protein AWU59_880 [Methanolobus sp. T82-4]|nr:MAG: hypothetical protein AWU59_880 [Methanolobus sp. T82-4]